MVGGLPNELYSGSPPPLHSLTLTHTLTFAPFSTIEQRSGTSFIGFKYLQTHCYKIIYPAIHIYIFLNTSARLSATYIVIYRPSSRASLRKRFKDYYRLIPYIIILIRLYDFRSQSCFNAYYPIGRVTFKIFNKTMFVRS